MTTATVTGDRDGDRLSVVVGGEVDLSNAAEVQRQILDLTSNHLVHVLIDLSGVGYLDSAGLRMLFVLVDRLGISQIGLELLVPDDSPVRTVLELVGLSTVATVRAGPE